MSFSEEINILKIEENQFKKLQEISIITFLESHGHSASKEDMDIYIQNAFSDSKIINELQNPENIFNFLYFKNNLVGYSKLVINYPYDTFESMEYAKLDRIYIKKEYYQLGIGQFMLDYNLKICQDNNQLGIWLYTWIKNERGLKFYKKNNFEIIDKKEFKLSASHSNPNYIMLKPLTNNSQK